MEGNAMNTNGVALSVWTPWRGAVQCLLIIPLPDIKHLLTISRVFIDSQKKSDALQTAFIIKGKKKGKKSSQLDAIHINNYQISSTRRVKWGIVDMISMSIIKKGRLVNTPLRARIISYRRTNYSYLIWSHQMKALMRRRKERFGKRGDVLHRWRFQSSWIEYPFRWRSGEWLYFSPGCVEHRIYSHFLEEFPG